MDFLIVDDDELICEGVARRLTEMAELVPVGRVYSRYSGEDALAFLNDIAVDVLITDIRMHEMDGLSLVEKAKELMPHMGFVIVTAYREMAYAQQAIRLGVDDFLIKPYSVQTMQETVLRVVARLKTQQEKLHRQLSRALLLGISQGEVMPQALFAEHGAACPQSGICLAAWEERRAFPVATPDGIWAYALFEEPFFLCWHAPGRADAFRRWLQDVAVQGGASLGISRPGLPLSEMGRQCQDALSLVWYWRAPRAIFYAPQIHADNDAARKLTRCIRGMQLQQARTHLTALLTGEYLRHPRRAQSLYGALYANLVQLLAEYELDAAALPAKPAPYQGFEQAFYRLFDAAERVLSGITNQAYVNPVAWSRRYAQEHFHENIDMADLASKLKLSYSYFSKLFKDQTGTTFSEYLLDLRMQEAKRLLMYGLPVTNVAEQVGYTSVYNFTRAFTRKFEIAPAKWRKEAVQGCDRK